MPSGVKKCLSTNRNVKDILFLHNVCQSAVIRDRGTLFYQNVFYCKFGCLILEYRYRSVSEDEGYGFHLHALHLDEAN